MQFFCFLLLNIICALMEIKILLTYLLTVSAPYVNTLDTDPENLSLHVIECVNSSCLVYQVKCQLATVDLMKFADILQFFLIVYIGLRNFLYSFPLLDENISGLGINTESFLTRHTVTKFEVFSLLVKNNLCWDCFLHLYVCCFLFVHCIIGFYFFYNVYISF